MAIVSENSTLTPGSCNFHLVCNWARSRTPPHNPYETVNDTNVVYPNELKFYIHNDFDGIWVQKVLFNIICTRYSALNLGDAEGAYIYISIESQNGIHTYEATELSAGVEGSYPCEVEINDWVSGGGEISFTVSSAYNPLYNTSTDNFSAGWYMHTGGSGTPFFAPNSEFQENCRYPEAGGQFVYPWHEVYYDQDIKTPTTRVGDDIGTGMVYSYNPSYDDWEETHSQSDTWMNANILRMATSGSQSDIYRVNQFTKTSVVATIASGQADIMVSNDGTNFVTYGSLTSSGYIAVTGFSYVRIDVASGTVESAALTAQRRFSRCAIEPQAPRENFRVGKCKSFRGWGKGDR